MSNKVLAITAFVLALANSAASAKVILDVTPTATTIDGNTDPRATAQIGGAFVVASTEIQSTGTGVIQPFLTLQTNNNHLDQERGYNTNAPSSQLPLDDARTPSAFVRAVQVGQLQSVTIGTTSYIQFLLDANQVSNGTISLNQVQIFLSSADPLDNYSLQEADSTHDAVISFPTVSPTEIFRLNDQQNNGTDLTTNKEILVDSSHGSGSGDMFLYVRSSLFGTDTTKYVTFFSQFGVPTGGFTANDGFEEWATRTGTFLPPQPPPVPEPSTLASAMVGLFVAGLVARRRSRRRTDVATG